MSDREGGGREIDWGGGVTGHRKRQRGVRESDWRGGDTERGRGERGGNREGEREREIQIKMVE